MSKKSKIILCVIGIFLVTSILIGISYAYYIFNVSQSGSNVVRTDCFEITYTDNNPLNIANAIPLKEEEASSLTPYTFTINNICNHDINYSINIETLDTTTMDLDAIRVKLNDFQSKILGNIIDNDSSVIVNNDVLLSKTINRGNLRANQSKEFDLYVWVDEDATQEQSANKIFSSKVVVYTSLYNEKNITKLISGPLFNQAIKELAGDEISSESKESLDKYFKFLADAHRALGEDGRDYYLQFLEEYEGLSDETISYEIFLDKYSNIFSDKSKDYYEINRFYETNDFNYLMLFPDTNIKYIKVSNYLPDDNITTKVVSSDDSKEKIVAWFDDGTVYLYSNNSTIYFDESIAFIFANLTSLVSVDMSSFDSSNTVNMFAAFYNTLSLESIDLSYMDTSNVMDMSWMFKESSNIVNLNLNNFDTSSVVDMSYIFYGAESLKNLSIDNFNTSNVKDMAFMFCGDENLTSLNVSSFDTSKVEDMSFMFDNLHSIHNLSVTNFNTSNVKSMAKMFFGIKNLDEIDLSLFDTSKVEDMSSMFENSEFKTLNLSSFNTSNVSDMTSMFAYATKLENLNLNGFDTSKITNMYGMFNGISIITLDLSSFDTSNVKVFNFAFNNMSNVETIYVSNKWSIASMTDSMQMFSGCEKLVGGSGTAYSSTHTNAEYARIDDPENGKPGYFTLKTT